MLIWLNLLIPVFVVAILVIFFRSKMAWWEYLLVFGIPFITIAVCKFTSVISQTNTNECWNSYAIRACYYEAWDEWDNETCYRTVTDADGDSHTESYDCSHRDYYPAYWEVEDNIGGSYHIDQSYYKFLVSQWGQETFEDMHRDYYTQDGDKYFSNYNNNFDKLLPLCTKHIYKNKVRSSKSIFNFQDVSKEDFARYGLYDYPNFKLLNSTQDLINYNPILGWNNIADSKKLQRYNGALGSWKKVHMMILVFRDKPYEASLMQEAYWKGGNKNEFVLCIGISKNKIKWTKVISWTDKQDLKVYVTRVVKEMDTLNMSAVIDIVAANVRTKFVKKDFHDFDYITIEPSDTAILITLILTIISTVGLAIFSILNQFDVDSKPNTYSRRYRR